MKPNYRYVIEQRFFAEKSFWKIAGDLGIPEQTVRTRYKRGIKQLEKNPQLKALASSEGLEEPAEPTGIAGPAF